MKLHKSLSFYLIFFFLLACASKKVAQSQSESSDTSRLHEERATVYLYRIDPATGATGQLGVRVNGMDAGGTTPNTFFKWELKPGTYTFMTYTKKASVSMEVKVKAGRFYFIRQEARMGINEGKVSMRQVSESKGNGEVVQCKLLVSSYLPE